MSDTKTLYLVRHANSGWQDSSQLDYDRVLSERGNREAVEMGKRLQHNVIRPDAVICSPAWRATQTIEHLAPFMAISMDDVLFKKSIYEAAASTLLQIVQELDDSLGSAMLVGHNPSLSWLASHVSGEPIDNMPPCSMATICIASSHWKDAGSIDAELLNLAYPQ